LSSKNSLHPFHHTFSVNCRPFSDENLNGILFQGSLWDKGYNACVVLARPRLKRQNEADTSTHLYGGQLFQIYGARAGSAPTLC
jgi:hypothetical protein